jgi:hypothetical protein
MIDLFETSPCKNRSEKRLGSTLNFFRTNIEHMNYAAFILAEIYVDSVVIEAGCKVIVGNRLKNTDMQRKRLPDPVGPCTIRTVSFLILILIITHYFKK